MTLEDYRTENGLTYGGLADLIGVSSARQAHKYAVGAAAPRPEIAERIKRCTDGSVTPNDLHDVRIAWLRDHGHFNEPENIVEAQP